MPETDSDGYFNAAVLIDRDGVIGRHRKSHPYISEPKWARLAISATRFSTTPIGRIALLICMDIHFVEIARLVALQATDVICHISNWLAERTPAPYWISRAFENGCYLIESNRWGLERTDPVQRRQLGDRAGRNHHGGDRWRGRLRACRHGPGRGSGAVHRRRSRVRPAPA